MALQVCATCFDLSVSLLRVLEMTVTLVPEIFLDWSRPSAELLLRRLAQVGSLFTPPPPPPPVILAKLLTCHCGVPQLLNQVLNRVTAEKNLFDRVVNLRLPGMHV